MLASRLWVACKSDQIFLILITEVKKFILFADADDNSTRFVSLDTTCFATQTLFHHIGIQRQIALDYDPVEDRVYWSDIAQGRILSAFFNATSAKTLFRCNVQTPDGLAIDHVGRNIYWTDTGTNRIEVGKLDGTARKLLIKGGSRMKWPGTCADFRSNGIKTHHRQQIQLQIDRIALQFSKAGTLCLL